MCIIRSIYLVIGAYWHTSIPAYQAYQANQLVTIQLPASSSWSYPAIQLSGYPAIPTVLVHANMQCIMIYKVLYIYIIILNTDSKTFKKLLLE